MDSSQVSIDWPQVESAVLRPADGEANILSYEYEDVKLMLGAAVEKWLANDLALLGKLQVEREFYLVGLGPLPVKGFIDLEAKYEHGEFAGQRLVADWKTSEGELDKTWQDRLILSYQWKLYALESGADCISYRGVNRKGKTRELFIRVYPQALEQVKRQFESVGSMLSNLAASNAQVWPQKMPSACGAFGSTCPFLEDCKHDTMPRYSLAPSDLTLSYSGQDRFLLCPEKYRRMNRSEEDGGNDATRVGQAFHRGIEEIYRQAFIQGVTEA